MKDAQGLPWEECSAQGRGGGVGGRAARAKAQSPREGRDPNGWVKVDREQSQMSQRPLRQIAEKGILSFQMPAGSRHSVLKALPEFLSDFPPPERPVLPSLAPSSH